MSFFSRRVAPALAGAVLEQVGKATLDFVWQKGCPDCARAKPVVEKAARALGLALRMYEPDDAPFPVGIVPALRLEGRIAEAGPETEAIFTSLAGLSAWVRGSLARVLPCPRRRAFGYVDFR